MSLCITIQCTYTSTQTCKHVLQTARRVPLGLICSAFAIILSLAHSYVSTLSASLSRQRMQDQIKDAVYRAVPMRLNKRADVIFFQMKCGDVTTDRDGVRDFSLSFTQHISQSLSLITSLLFFLTPTLSDFLPVCLSFAVMNMI